MNPEILFKTVNALDLVVWMMVIVALKWKLTHFVVNSYSGIIIICLI